MSVTTRITFHNIGHIMKNMFSRKSITRVPLGRWGVSKNNNACNLTIDYSNEDHCGACSASHVEGKITTIQKRENNDELFYYEYIHMNTNSQNSKP